MHKNFHTAVAIFLGFALVALAILLRGSFVHPMDQKKRELFKEIVSREENAHVYGEVDAEIRIVEFSDLECPFCARLHPVLMELVDNSNGDIAWEYRHLPLMSHENAETLALASECVALHAGEEAFFAYTGELLAAIGTTTNDYYVQEATKYGVAEDALRKCLGDSQILERVTNDVIRAQELGAEGTPFNVILGPDGYSQVVPGALPKEEWVNLLQSIL
jgi:protein-disulfide isomerase